LLKQLSRYNRPSTGLNTGSDQMLAVRVRAMKKQRRRDRVVTFDDDIPYILEDIEFPSLYKIYGEPPAMEDGA
jgi:hypothetical protein